MSSRQKKQVYPPHNGLPTIATSKYHNPGSVIGRLVLFCYVKGRAVSLERNPLTINATQTCQFHQKVQPWLTKSSAVSFDGSWSTSKPHKSSQTITLTKYMNHHWPMKLLTTVAFTARDPWHNPSNHLDVVRKYLFEKIQCFVSLRVPKRILPLFPDFS